MKLVIYLFLLLQLLQALYYSVCLINDILGPKDAETGNTTTLNRVKDFMEASIAFPIAMVKFSFSQYFELK